MHIRILNAIHNDTPEVGRAAARSTAKEIIMPKGIQRVQPVFGLNRRPDTVNQTEHANWSIVISTKGVCRFCQRLDRSNTQLLWPSASASSMLVESQNLRNLRRAKRLKVKFGYTIKSYGSTILFARNNRMEQVHGKINRRNINRSQNPISKRKNPVPSFRWHVSMPLPKGIPMFREGSKNVMQLATSPVLDDRITNIESRYIREPQLIMFNMNRINRTSPHKGGKISKNTSWLNFKREIIRIDSGNHKVTRIDQSINRQGHVTLNNLVQGIHIP